MIYRWSNTVLNCPVTLTLPVGKKKAPVVILVHGSGPQDRDETVGPNKPFRDLAWGLAERGIATVRYDKRTKEMAQCVQITNLTVYNEYITDVIIAVIVYMAAFSLIIKMWIAERQKKRAKKAEQAAPAAPAAETPAEKRGGAEECPFNN